MDYVRFEPTTSAAPL